MNRWVPFVVFALALAALPSAAAHGHDLVDQLVGDKDGDPAPESTEETVKGAKGSLPDEPDPAVGLLEGLLNGAAGLVSDTGGAIADGFVGVTSAIGGFLAAVATATWQGTVWVVGTIAGGTATAFLWSARGAWSVMTGTVEGAFWLIGTTVGGAWTGIERAAMGIADLRPGGMSEAAWAGTVAVTATGASAAANFGLLEALRRFGWTAGAGMPLFSRIAKDDILEHPLRSEIFETIKTNPGIHISALARQVDAGWGTTIHHLRKLQEKELVAVRLVNNQKCFFHNGGQAGRSTWTQLPELKNETASRIARYVLANPLTPVTGISDHLGISPSLVSHHVRKLEKAGVVEKHRDGRFVKLAVTESARGALFGEKPAVPAAEVPGVAA